MRSFNSKISIVALAVVVTSASVCPGRTVVTAPGPTPPTPNLQLGPVLQIEAAPFFRNVSHPSISAAWGRRKTDAGGSILVNLGFSLPGLNWIPVFDGPVATINATTRVEKHNVCGEVHESVVFTGAASKTQEFDWGLILDPDEKRFVDTLLLQQSASRVRPIMKVKLEDLKSAKFFYTPFWNRGSGKFLVEAEVTPPQALLRATANPFPCVDGPCRFPGGKSGSTERVRAPKRVCVYGPWVQEALHGFRPEIHPSEAIYWTGDDGALYLAMILDASGRYDARDPKQWLTTFGITEAKGEHWVQEAMIGEFLIPATLIGEAPTITVVSESGLEQIGSGGYPPSTLSTGVTIIPVTDARIQAVAGSSATGTRGVAIRAQIRGASKDDALVNGGAHLLLRISRPGR